MYIESAIRPRLKQVWTDAIKLETAGQSCLVRVRIHDELSNHIVLTSSYHPIRRLRRKENVSRTSGFVKISASWNLESTFCTSMESCGSSKR